MAEMLKSTSLTAEQQDILRNIVWSSDHLLAVINDVLDLSKIEANKLELEQIPTNVFEIVEQALTLIANKEHKPDVELCFDIDRSVSPVILTDPTRLRQIVVNLVGNSIKFTEKGNICVSAQVITSMDCEADCPCHTPGNVLIRFAVADTGMGIPIESQGHLLESFAQADKTVSRKHGGTGLGLSISAQLAQAMGRAHSPVTTKGRRGLWFDSTVGKGSTFYFCIISRLCTPDPDLFTPIPHPNGVPMDLPTALIFDGCEQSALCIQSFLRRLDIPSHIILRHDLMKGVTPRRPSFIISAAQSSPFEICNVPALATVPSIVAMPQSQVLLYSNFRKGLDVGNNALDRAGLRPDIRIVSKPFVLSRLRQEILNLLKGPGEAFIEDTAVQSPVELDLKVRCSRPFKVLHTKICSQPLRHECDYSTSPPQNVHVLLAEDNAINQKIIRRQLELIGCRVTVASNGQEAVDRIAQQPDGFQICFMDCQMPVLDGLEATSAIRTKLRVQSLPIVALSASTLGEDVEAALESGMNDYLTKPTKEDLLRGMITKHCKKFLDS